MLCAAPITSLLPSLSSAVLRSAWVEPDVSVRNAMWGGVLGLLKGTSERYAVLPEHDRQRSVQPIQKLGRLPPPFRFPLPEMIGTKKERARKMRMIVTTDRTKTLIVYHPRTPNQRKTRKMLLSPKKRRCIQVHRRQHIKSSYSSSS